MKLIHLIIWTLSLSPQQKNVYIDQLSLKFKSCDTINIDGLLWSPRENKSDILAIFVLPCLTKKMSIQTKSDSIQFTSRLKEKLLKNGISCFSFSSREAPSLYKSSTLFTKAADLESAMNYFKSKPELNYRKFIIIGQSEGGASGIIVASCLPNIHALILLSAPVINGKDLQNYQYANNDTLIINTFGSNPKFYESFFTFSPIKGKSYEHNITGFRNFQKDLYGPLDSIVATYEGYDTIANEVNKYIKNTWDHQSDSVKLFFKTLANYSMLYYKSQRFTSPQQIALTKWNPSLYFSKIQCPILALYGDHDMNVDYISSLNNIKKFLDEARNTNVNFMVLKGYNHYLENEESKRNKILLDSDSFLSSVLEWIKNL
jgi:pimeloyl-ACP methyl ester carboxylesterase